VTVVDDIRARAVERPDHPAIQIAHRGDDAVETLTYGELVESFTDRAALLARATRVDGCRVGMVAPQGREFVETALAILAAGGCLVPIPSDQSEESLRDFAGKARVEALVRVGDGLGLEAVDAGDALPADVRDSFRTLDPAYVRFTSGTTNERKGVVLSHARILERLDAANRGMSISRDDRVLWLLPMAHHFVVSILLYLRNGATILLPSGSLAQPVLEIAASLRPTVFYASPYHYGLLAKDASSGRLDSVRLAVSTAEGLRADIAALFAERFELSLVQALGIIEVGLPVMNHVSAATKPTALGRPLPDYDVWLRDEAGRPVVERGSADRCGEVCIRGPGMFDAYLDPWTPSADIVEPDGFRTGDQGWFDADGDLHLIGRRTNRINMAGMKFFSEEVEAVLDRHPAIAASRVLARAHPHLGQIPVAEVVISPSAREPSRRELTDYCRDHLPTYKIPRQFQIVERLPKTVTGKLRRV